MSKKKILYVEDEPDLRILVSNKLKKLGYEVQQAGDGEEGLRIAQEFSPDLIISDVIMPKVNGSEFLKKLRQTEWGAHIPFIILTARVKMKDYFEAVEVDCFLDKPFKVEELVDKIERILSGEKLEAGPDDPPAEAPQGKKPDQSGTQKESAISDKMEYLIEDRALDVKKAGPDIDAPPSNTASQNIKKEQVPKNAPASKKKILLLETEEPLYSQFQKVFSEQGCEVHLVKSPQECLEAAGSFVPDVIMLKESPGGLSTKDLAVRLKGRESLKKTPIVIYQHVGESVPKNDTSEGKEFIFNAAGKAVINKVNEFLAKLK